MIIETNIILEFEFDRRLSEMKKINNFINILICTSLGLWVIQAMLSYSNYTRHVELYATNVWFWYDDVMVWGKYIIPTIAVCLIAKFIIYKRVKG